MAYHRCTLGNNLRGYANNKVPASWTNVTGNLITGIEDYGLTFSNPAVAWYSRKSSINVTGVNKLIITMAVVTILEGTYGGAKVSTSTGTTTGSNVKIFKVPGTYELDVSSQTGTVNLIVETCATNIAISEIKYE